MAFVASKILRKQKFLGRLLSYQSLYECEDDHGLVVSEASTHHNMLEQLSGNTSNTVENMMTGKVMTYDEIAGNSLKTASKLKACGINVGDHVMLYSPNNENYIASLLGIMAIGAIPCLANPAYTEYELGALCKSSDAKYLISSKVNNQIAQKISAEQNIPLLCTVDDMAEFSADCDPISDLHASHPDDVAVIGYSSGTTGLPKGVQLTHKNLAYERKIAGYEKFSPPRPVQALIMPWYHAFGFTQLGLSVDFHTDIKFLSHFDPAIFLQTIQQCRPTILEVVPPLLLFLAKHPVVSKFDISSLKYCVSGAAPLTKDLIDELTARHPHIISCRQGYGMTETTAAHTAQHLACTKVGSVGTPLPFCTTKIVHPGTEDPVLDGGPGEILMGGPVIMKGYYKNDKANAETLTEDGFVRSGDIGKMDKDGTLYITDRLKELIKVKGYQVAPAELEGVLTTHPGIMDAAVIGVPDERAGEVPKAFVTPAPGANITEEDVKNFIASKMSVEKRLGSVEFLDAIPKLPSGKILRKDLRKMEESRRK
ncbi:hypothetical protein ACHWQZ_G011430 [Mnemiopsis leidyi]